MAQYGVNSMLLSQAQVRDLKLNEIGTRFIYRIGTNDKSSGYLTAVADEEEDILNPGNFFPIADPLRWIILMDDMRIGRAEDISELYKWDDIYTDP